MDYPNNSRPSSGFGLGSIILVILGLFAIYYLYRFLYSAPSTNVVTIIPGKQKANIVHTNLPDIPIPFEGGEYSFSTWLYLSNFSQGSNQRKHIFELKGKQFSTLIVAIDAFKNNLVVRTHSKTPEGFQVEGFQPTSETPAPPMTSETPAPPALPGTTPPVTPSMNTSTQTPSSSAVNGNLSATNVTSMFQTFAMNDSIMTDTPVCDITEVELQRWVMVTVVLSGKTIDVYMDGKLARSCVTPSYYKVDPTGVAPIVTDKGGFDGYISNMSVANYAMNPDEIYRTYIAGPSGTSGDVMSWIASLFKGAA